MQLESLDQYNQCTFDRALSHHLPWPFLLVAHPLVALLSSASEDDLVALVVMVMLSIEIRCDHPLLLFCRGWVLRLCHDDVDEDDI